MGMSLGSSRQDSSTEQERILQNIMIIQYNLSVSCLPEYIYIYIYMYVRNSKQ